MMTQTVEQQFPHRNKHLTLHIECACDEEFALRADSDAATAQLNRLRS